MLSWLASINRARRAEQRVMAVRFTNMEIAYLEGRVPALQALIDYHAQLEQLAKRNERNDGTKYRAERTRFESSI